MAGIIVAIAILLGVYCFVCKDKHQEGEHEKPAQQEEIQEDTEKKHQGSVRNRRY